MASHAAAGAGAGMTGYLRGLAVDLALPPLGLVVATVLLAVIGWRGRRTAPLAAALCGVLVLLLATPFVAGALTVSLDRATPGTPADAPAAGAIIILGGEIARGASGPEVGPLTLERLRAGAALHRRLGLPVLVTGGAQRPNELSLAEMMARSLATDFGVVARWRETAARDTRDNAALSAAMLRADGIDAAYLVTHAWHMARAVEAFRRGAFPIYPAPVRHQMMPDGRVGDWMPRPDHLATSWFALREWLGRVVYALRDGG